MPCSSLNLLYFGFTCINATVEELFKGKSLYLTCSLCTPGSSRNSNIFERRMTEQLPEGVCSAGHHQTAVTFF